MKMISTALALSLLALVTTAPAATAARASIDRTSNRSLSGEVLELRNEWRRDVRFTVSRVDQGDPFEFRLERANRGRDGRSRLNVGPVAPGGKVSVVVLTDGRVSQRDLRGNVLVTVTADERRGRVLDRYVLPVDLSRRSDRYDRYDRNDRDDRYDRNDRNDRRDRYDRNDRCDRDDRYDRDRRNAAWEREHRGHAHGRRQVCNFRGRPSHGRPLHARDLLRFVIAARHRN